MYLLSVAWKTLESQAKKNLKKKSFLIIIYIKN